MGCQYVLTDIAGAHYWTGAAFIRVQDWPDLHEEVPRFATRRAARREALRLRRESECYLAVAPAPDDHGRILEAILCTLIDQAGGAIALPAEQIEACGNRYRLARSLRGRSTVVLRAEEH